jgi:hypothetical protein
MRGDTSQAAPALQFGYGPEILRPKVLTALGEGSVLLKNGDWFTTPKRETSLPMQCCKPPWIAIRRNNLRVCSLHF